MRYCVQCRKGRSQHNSKQQKVATNNRICGVCVHNRSKRLNRVAIVEAGATISFTSYVVGMDTTHLEQIRQNLEQLTKLTEKAWDDLVELFRPVTLARNDYIIQEGEHAHDCYVLLDGIARVYYNNDGKEYNKTFFVPGMFPTPLTALLSGAPSTTTIQVLTDSTLLAFSYQGFCDLFATHRCLESLMLAIVCREWIKKERHDIHMVTNSASENYRIFQQNFPTLEQHIPQYHIASYLGITPIQLSRIRAGK